MSTALIAPTYAEIVRAYKHFELLNGSPVALQYLLASTPTPTGAELETWLQTPENLTAFEQLISAPNGTAAVAASSTAMAAVAASSTAMAAVAASSTAMAAVAASSTAMAAVIASSTAMAAVFNSAVAKGAIWASDIAVGAIAASSTAYDWLIANKAVTSAATNVTTTPGTAFDSGKSLLLDVVMSATATNVGILFTTKQGTVGDATGPDSTGIRYTTSRFKNIMAVNNLTCLDGTSGNASYTVTLRYVVMD
ncbi:MAG: hypothetical protein AB7U63_19730 [Porticoccaceae bacterium]